MNILKKLLTSKNCYVGKSYKNKNTSIKINNLIIKCLGRKIDLLNQNDLQTLSLEDIKNIDANIRLKYQKQFVKILKPELSSITNGFLDKNDIQDFRVGAQCKHKKNQSNNNDNLKNTMHNSNKMKKFLGDSFYSYPTVPHQDLSSNGYRSSSVFIFYFQITPPFKNSCMLQFSKFKKNIGLLEEEKKIIGNELHYLTKNKAIEKTTWVTPKTISPGKITIFNSMTLHKTGDMGETPRLALNIKIHPKSIKYLYRIFNIKLNFEKKKINHNLNILQKDLAKIAKYNNIFNFELAIVALMKGKISASKIYLQKLCLFKLNKNMFNKILIGAKYRLCLEDMVNFKKLNVKQLMSKKKIVKFSILDSILRTFN